MGESRMNHDHQLSLNILGEQHITKVTSKQKKQQAESSEQETGLLSSSSYLPYPI